MVIASREKTGREATGRELKELPLIDLIYLFKVLEQLDSNGYALQQKLIKELCARGQIADSFE